MTVVAPEMKIRAVAPWYGANRSLAELAGGELGGLDWCGVPFCGGCSELPFIRTKSGTANDLHRHIINLARVMADPVLRKELAKALALTLFHADELADARIRCRARERSAGGALFDEGDGPEDVGGPDLDWARDYFVCCWMGRGGSAGQDDEFTGQFTARYTASGGDSATRFRNAVGSIAAWHRVLLAWNFTTIDALAFIDKCHDRSGHGLYVDAPWMGAVGDKYEHRLTNAQHRALARKLAEFRVSRVVVRYGDCGLARELYPADRWTWIENASRNQSGNEVAEVLIINGPRYREAAR